MFFPSIRKRFQAAASVIAVFSCGISYADISPDGWIRQNEWSGVYLGTHCGNGNATCDGCGPAGDIFSGPGHADVDWTGGAGFALLVPGLDLAGAIGFVDVAGTDVGPSGFRGDSVVRALGDHGAGDVVDHNVVLEQLGQDTDNVYGIAQTVVSNTTAETLDLLLCTASDDSIIVFVDDAGIYARSTCRGTAGGCAESAVISMPPGEHVISTIVHEGGGGFGFRFRFENGDGPINSDNAAASGLEFKGPPTEATVPSGGVTLTDLTGDATDITGDLRAKNYSLLIGLSNPFGANAGGPDVMATRDWLAPHNVSLEDPKVGNRWNDLDVGPASISAAFGGATIWLSTSALEQNFPDFANGFNPNNGIFDFNDTVERLSDAVGADPRYVQDNVFGVSTVYVRNNTADPIPVGICTASDDSIQVWVNHQLVANVSAARGVAGGCAEIHPAVLDPGMNKISTFVWEGGGGWGQRLRIIKPDGRAYTDRLDGTDAIEIISPDHPDYRNATTPAYAARRDAAVRDRGCPSETITITLNGESGGADDAEVQFVEFISRAPDYSRLSVDAPRGTVTELFKATGQSDEGFLQAWVHLGPYSSSECNNGDDNTLDWLTDGVVGQSEFEPVDGSTIATDFAVARSAAILENGGRNPGAVPTATFVVDPDDTINYQDLYVDDVNNVMMYSYAYFTLHEDCTGLQVGVASDDAIEVLVGPVGGSAVQVHRNDACRGFDAANVVQDRSGAFDLPAGDYKVIVKVFEGGGGHGFRLRFEKNGEPLRDPAVVSFSATPGGDALGDGQTYALRVEHTIAVSDLRDGVTYDVAYDGIATLHFEGTVAGAVSGLLPPLDAVFAPQTGPVGPFEDSHAIGNNQSAGGSLTDNGDESFTMEFSGDDIWDGGDNMYYAYKSVTGDFDASVRITQRTNPAGSRWGKHGLMARQTCHPNSRYSLAATHVSGEGAYDTPRHQARRDHQVNGTSMDHRILPAVGAGLPVNVQPEWIRLIRCGPNFVSMFADADPETGEPVDWIVAGSMTHPEMPDTVFVGLAGTSHDGANLASVTFRDFSCEQVEWPEPAFPPVEESVSYDFELANDADLSAEFGAAVNTTNFVPTTRDGRLTITDDTVASTAATVWFPDEIPADRALEIEFDFFVSGEGDNADGFNVALTEVVSGDLNEIANKIGDAGGSAGYDTGDYNAVPQDPRRRIGFACEIDNWDGGVGSNDRGPSNPHYHIGLNANDDNQSGQNSFDNGFGGDNGSAGGLPAVHNVPEGAHIRMIYQPVEEALARVQIVLSSNVAGSTFGEQTVVSGFVPALRGNAFIGVTGGTGGAAATQQIDNLVVRVAPPGGGQVPGDFNQDGGLDLSDPVSLLNHLFLGGPPPSCGDGTLGHPSNVTLLDSNGDGQPDLSDAVYTLAFLFLGGPAPLLNAQGDCVLIPECPTVCP